MPWTLRMLNTVVVSFLKISTSVIISVRCVEIDYCSLSCYGISHTMCDYPAGGGPGCNIYTRGLFEEEQEMILDLHNYLRQKVATGNEFRGEQPSSSDMLEMFWSPEAAMIAQRWADQCTSFGHDSCRRTVEEEHVGQNIGWLSGYGDPREAKSRADAIKYFITEWYNEVENYRGDVDLFDSSLEELQKIGHYTQIVWARSAGVGCGFLEFTDATEYEYRIVCNYVPGGNYRSMKVYSRGAPCSRCPSNSTCSRRWPGLCSMTNAEYDDGNIELDEDLSVEPEVTTKLIDTYNRSVTFRTPEESLELQHVFVKESADENKKNLLENATNNFNASVTVEIPSENQEGGNVNSYIDDGTSNLEAAAAEWGDRKWRRERVGAEPSGSDKL
ncbi:hypothetical protein J6590_018501 [Homalodisca vitripennis]|nr:hypothetical protein J6590_018501 [Homalodisca vitripennis]